MDPGVAAQTFAWEIPGKAKPDSAVRYGSISNRREPNDQSIHRDESHVGIPMDYRYWHSSTQYLNRPSTTDLLERRRLGRPDRKLGLEIYNHPKT